MKFVYIPSDWPEWHGHYDKPVGKEPVFHVNANNEIHVVKRDDYDTYLYTAEESNVTCKLAEIINKCKKYYSGCPGGGFCINEYGQVIVPLTPRKDSSGNVLEWREPRYVGRIYGDIPFFDGEDEILFSKSMKCGDIWPYPYLGMKYHLSYKNTIYRKLQEGNDIRIIYLKRKYDELVDNLHKIRGTGPCSFLVNPWGVILTKKESGRDSYVPVYVGKLNYAKWFEQSEFDD